MFALLEKGFFKLMQHDLEVSDILHTELRHMLLELSLLIINFALQLNDALSES